MYIITVGQSPQEFGSQVMAEVHAQDRASTAHRQSVTNFWIGSVIVIVVALVLWESVTKFVNQVTDKES